MGRTAWDSGGARALERAGVQATFFVLGERVEAYPELLEDVIDRGHEVEVHGYAHLRHPESTRDEVAGTWTWRWSRSSAWASNPSGGGSRGGIWPTSRSELAAERQLEIVGWDARHA